MRRLARVRERGMEARKRMPRVNTRFADSPFQTDSKKWLAVMADEDGWSWTHMQNWSWKGHRRSGKCSDI